MKNSSEDSSHEQPKATLGELLIKYLLYSILVALIVAGAVIACSARARFYLLHFRHFIA